MSGPAACAVGNIARSGRRRRALLGAGAGLATAAAFVVLDAKFGSRAWRAALLPGVAFAALCFLQARAST